MLQNKEKRIIRYSIFFFDNQRKKYVNLFKLWNELCELVSKNPTKIKSVQVEPIIRQGIVKYKDQVGQLWTSLADYYIRSGCFEKVF